MEVSYSIIRSDCLVYCRFYMNRKGLCSIQMVDAEFEYTYEYQGNAAKLVHTPLTDKCYLTLTQGQKSWFILLYLHVLLVKTVTRLKFGGHCL